MEKQSFWKTRAGHLTLAFIVIMAAFLLIMAGLAMSSEAVCVVGFVLIAAAMLYSPIEVYVLKRK